MGECKLKDKRKQFEKLYLTGKFNQKELSETIGITAATANKWVKDIQPLNYFTIRKNLTNDLTRLTKQKRYEEISPIISQLITDIERIERLIIKAKYIPHLTN